MEKITINFSDFINNPNNVDFLSGRKVGQKKYKDSNIENKIDGNYHFTIVIDDHLIKGINDSFIKGFFSDIFRKMRTRENFYKKFTIDAIDHYKKLFEKNFKILEILNEQ